LYGSNNLLLLISSTLFLGYIGNLFYTRTKIPDIVWLLFFGILLGPGLNFFNKETFLSLSPLMSVLAIVIILFEAGISINLETVLTTMSKYISLTIISYVAQLIFIGLLLNLILPTSFTLLQAWLLGAMVGGSSTVSVLSVLRGVEKIIPDSESARVILTMESVISDPIGIIVSITLIQRIITPQTSLLLGVGDIIFILILSSVIGFFSGFAWVMILDKLRDRPFNNVLTIALLFPLYLFVDQIIGNGGGAMAALVFGLVISNSKEIATRLGRKIEYKVDNQKMKEFHEEISFFVRSFFFVFVGLIATLRLEYILVGLTVVAAIVILRYSVGTMVGEFFDFSRTEKILSRLVFAQGLPAFVMAQLPSIYDPNKLYFVDPQIYVNLSIPIVLGTVIIDAVFGPIIAQRQLKK
jgi:cell volume regulation protein A